MKAAYLFAGLLIFGLSSCMWGVPPNKTSAIVKDTLHYTYKIFKERAADCGNKPDSECTVVKIKYPVFKDQIKLNDSVIRRLTHLFQIDDVVETSNLDIYGRSFLKGYETVKNRHQDEIFHYTLKSSAIVLREDSALTTLQFSGYALQCGARATTNTYFINWNTKENREILLNDLFIDDYQENLTKIGEMIFRKDEKLTNTASLEKNYVFKGNQFSLNTNFSITPLGIRFFYNEYEIKPRGAGATDLFIPYTQIKSLLRPHTVVSQYIK